MNTLFNVHGLACTDGRPRGIGGQIDAVIGNLASRTGTGPPFRLDRVSPVRPNILQCIGNTPLIPLRQVRPKSGARIVLKIESANPTGSMKDRMALAMIDAAERDGRLQPGESVVEYTTGNTGTALAMVCGVKGHPLFIVTSDAYAEEKRLSIAIMGAQLRVIASDEGRMTEKLTLDMVEAARAIARDTGAYWTDQLRNIDQLEAYRQLAAEVWDQTNGRVDAFVQSVGSGGCLRGAAEALRQRSDEVQIIAVEPAESPVLSGGSKGAHGIDGMGAGFIVPLWEPALVNEIERVSTEEAMAMSIRLAREESLLAGPTTGANVTAALRIGERLGPSNAVVTLMCDSGSKYLKKFAGCARAV
jgi:cysteine synthase A